MCNVVLEMNLRKLKSVLISPSAPSLQLLWPRRKYFCAIHTTPLELKSSFSTCSADPIVCSALINKHVYTYSLKLLTISTFVILLVDQDGLVSSKDTR